MEGGGDKDAAKSLKIERVRLVEASALEDIVKNVVIFMWRKS